jgi:opacity protein-like surface antigen
MKRLVITAASVFLLLGAASSAALAGEVKGPPNQVDNTNETGALDHANSACAASGLNDFDTEAPQNVNQVQTAADSWNFYGGTPGDVGWGGLCVGGTGQVSHP